MDDASQSEAVTRLLRPRSIAIIGVSGDPGSIGGAVLANLERFGYGGEVHLVSRSPAAIGGRQPVEDIAQLPSAIDVAVMALPKAATVAALAACARRRVGAAIVFAAGFAEVGGEGGAQQQELARAARQGDIALLGPNCIGAINAVDGIPLTFEPIAPLPAEGPRVGVIAQSGAMSSTLRLALAAKGLALSHIVSTGNEAGLGAEAFLAFMLEQSQTRVIALFAEQLRQPARFLELAAIARERGRPIVMMHPGRSARARASAQSHTGAMVSDHDVMRTLVRQQAVVMVESIEELVDTTEMLARCEHPRPEGAAIVTNSGAFKGIALDFCEGLALDLPALSPALAASLREVVPPFASVENPLDITAQAIKDTSLPARATELLLADPAYGSVMEALVFGPPPVALARTNALLPVLAAAGKPAAVVAFGDESPLPPELPQMFRKQGICFFRSPERALRALAHTTAYARAVAAARPAEPLPLPEIELSQTGAIAEYRGKAILAALGIPVPPGGLAKTLADADALADQLGYPVALKVQARELTHKSEAGGVILNVSDRSALGAAWTRLNDNISRARPGLLLEGVLVEKMAPPGLEILAAGRRDPVWGPVLMVALGGIWTEALDDKVLLSPALSPPRIIAELGRLKGMRLLRGLRGSPPADLEALAATVARLGALMVAHPELTEVEINPLVVYPRGQALSALDVLMVVSESR